MLLVQEQIKMGVVCRIQVLVQRQEARQVEVIPLGEEGMLSVIFLTIISYIKCSLFFQLGGLFSKQFAKQKFVIKYRHNHWDRIWRTPFPCGLCLPHLVLPSSAKTVQTCQREAC